MKKMALGILIFLLLVISFVSYQFVFQSSNDYDVTLGMDEHTNSLSFHIYEKGTNKPAKLSRRLVHTHILPSDLSTLIHVHPTRKEVGLYDLKLDFIPESGEYDVWLEISIDDHHDGSFYKKFTLDLIQGENPIKNNIERRMTSELLEAKMFGPNELSHLHYLLRLDGEPIQSFSTYIGVEVHSFIVSKNRDYFAHDHAHLLGEGMIDAHMNVPRKGEYILFIEPTAVTENGDHKEVLLHEVSIE